jgi:PTH2 family peptidyl-tRNA hydrolase
MQTKQVIVLRRDLNMKRGKQIVQACHASMKVILDRGNFYEQGGFLFPSKVGFDIPHNKLTPEMIDWMEGTFTKICLSVGSAQELQDVYDKALAAGLPCALIEESSLADSMGKPTKTCVAIGPASNEEIDKITGGLDLL